MAEKRICFYHTDGDGYCSAALVARHYNWELELFPINYGHPFPWDKIDNETDVIMVDFSLQPFSGMIKLLNACKSLLWIDHHKSAVKEYWEWSAHTGLHIEGPKQIGEAACELTWCYYHDPKEEVPRAVDFLGRYDVWEWQGIKDCLEFEFGLRALPHVSPVEPEARVLWDALLGDNTYLRESVVDQLIHNGRVVLEQTRKNNKRGAKSGSFMVELDGIPMIACNVSGTNSQFFDAVLEDFPEALAVLTFSYRKEKWNVSMYQIEGRDTPDLGALAKKLGTETQQGGGGGGHPGAAGFQWHSWNLPFETPIDLLEKSDKIPWGGSAG